MPPNKTNAPKRHFSARSGPRKTGPGTLDGPPLGAPDSFRHMTSEAERDEFERRKAESKPTLFFNPLPPNIDVNAVRQLVSEASLHLKEVLLVQPANDIVAGPYMKQREHIAAILFVDQQTTRDEIDAAMSKLQNKYAGFGYWANVESWVTSWRVESQLPYLDLKDPSRPKEPFHAVSVTSSLVNYNRVAPPTFPPPASFAPQSSNAPQAEHGQSDKRVVVKPPNDLRKIRVINRMVMNLVLHGLDFEAAFKERTEVQMDPQFSFLFDSHSQEAIWYRWRYFEIMTGRMRDNATTTDTEYTIFAKQPMWKLSKENKIPFQFTAAAVELKEDPSFGNSNYHFFGKPASLVRNPDPENVDDHDAEWNFLNPSNVLKIIYMLYHLPSSTAKLDRKAVGRVSDFGIQCAGPGRSSEIVKLLVRNVLAPFSCSPSINFSKELFSQGNVDSFHKAVQNQVSRASASSQHQEVRKEGLDSSIKVPSSSQEATSKIPEVTEAMLVGLYVISDLLSVSRCSTNSYAKRYRALFEEEFEASGLFFKLGNVEKKFNLGLLRGERWRARINALIEQQKATDTLSKEAIASIKSEFERGSHKTASPEVKSEEPIKPGDEDLSMAGGPHEPISGSSKRNPGFKKMGATTIDPSAAATEKQAGRPAKRQKFSHSFAHGAPLSPSERQIDLSAAPSEDKIGDAQSPNGSYIRPSPDDQLSVSSPEPWKDQSILNWKSAWGWNRDPREKVTKRLKSQHKRRIKKMQARKARAKLERVAARAHHLRRKPSKV